MKRILGIAAIAGLATLSSLPAATTQGRFHLAVGAYLGKAFLAPGDYRISVLETGSGMKHVAVVGNGGSAYALPMVAEKEFSKGNSSLQLVELGGNYFVKEFRSQDTGKIYSFGVPKAAVQDKVTMEIRN
jgi:hypothetical protein